MIDYGVLFGIIDCYLTAVAIRDPRMNWYEEVRRVSFDIDCDLEFRRVAYRRRAPANLAKEHHDVSGIWTALHHF